MYPDNTLAIFTIHLAQTIDLGKSTDWEVGIFTCQPPIKRPRGVVAFDIVGETKY